LIVRKCSVTKHRIYTRHSVGASAVRLPIPLIKQSIRCALRLENIGVSCEVSVLITNDKRIRKINREFRGIDKPTDVLSFPMQEFSVPGRISSCVCATDPETGLLPLGDIILSSERVEKQARKHGQTREREAAFLTVHSVLHLLGYDHTDEANERKQMRGREKEIMHELGY